MSSKRSNKSENIYSTASSHAGGRARVAAETSRHRWRASTQQKIILGIRWAPKAQIRVKIFIQWHRYMQAEEREWQRRLLGTCLRSDWVQESIRKKLLYVIWYSILNVLHPHLRRKCSFSLPIILSHLPQVLHDILPLPPPLCFLSLSFSLSCH